MRSRYISYLSFGLLVTIGLTIPIILTIISKADSGVFIVDMFSLAKMPSFIGFLTNIGSFMWCATIGAIILTINTIGRNINAMLKLFLYYSLIINGWLLIDDFFMMHDYWFAILHIPELYTHLGLGIAIICFITIFFSIIRNTKYYLLLLALVFFILSLTVDATTDYNFVLEKGRWYHVFEDGPKWIGICFWAAYFFSSMRQILAANIANCNITV